MEETPQLLWTVCFNAAQSKTICSHIHWNFLCYSFCQLPLSCHWAPLKQSGLILRHLSLSYLYSLIMSLFSRLKRPSPLSLASLDAPGPYRSLLSCAGPVPGSPCLQNRTQCSDVATPRAEQRGRVQHRCKRGDGKDYFFIDSSDRNKVQTRQ